MKSDIRMSLNTEVPHDNSQGQKMPKSLDIKTTRIKERTSFDFQWLRLDFTVTQMIQANGT